MDVDNLQTSILDEKKKIPIYEVATVVETAGELTNGFIRFFLMSITMCVFR